MLHKAVLFLVSLFLFYTFSIESKKLDFKAITAVRHGLEIALDYINKNIYRSTVDCILGVAFVRAFMKTAYKYGFHIMDNSTQRLLKKSCDIIEKSGLEFNNDERNGNKWKVKSLIFKDIWTKPIDYKNHGVLSSWNRPIPVDMSRIPNWYGGRKSDICLQEIVNSTNQAHEIYAPCVITTYCWNNFFRNGKGHGYYLTHKLLLLQVAKARKCLLNERIYEMQVKDICSSILTEISNGNYYGKIDEFFDLFLEQVLLCGYEGYAEFIQNSWLFTILKSQQLTGCFSDDLTDKLKSRVKKDMTYFEDGCNDHTTGLGAAVLGLYYNFIINEQRVQ